MRGQVVTLQMFLQLLKTYEFSRGQILKVYRGGSFLRLLGACWRDSVLFLEILFL